MKDTITKIKCNACGTMVNRITACAGCGGWLCDTCYKRHAQHK